MNEMEKYGQRMSGDGAEEPQVDLVAGTDDTGETAAEAAPAAAAPGISKQKKNLVMAGVGGGMLLVVGLAVTNLMGRGAPQEQLVQYDNPPVASAQQGGDAGGMAPIQGQATGATPLIGDVDAQGAQASPVAPPQAPTPIAGVNQQPADANTPIPLSQMMGNPAMNTAAPAPSQQTGGPVQAAAPVAPAPAVAQVAPAAPTTPVPPAAPAMQAPVAPTAPAAPVSVAAVAGVPVQPANPGSAIKDAALVAEIDKLKAQVKDLQAQLEKANKKPAPRPATAPTAVATAKPAAPRAVAKPAAAVAAAPAEPVNVRASDLKGVVSQPGAKPTTKNMRNDFSIYAVTDGRVWVVGRDGERLGPLAVGSPLTDGSKITGIDVGRGVVLTNSGEIH